MKVFTYIRTVLTCLILVCLVLTSCAGQSNGAGNTWQEQYDLGVRYLSEGNYEEAIIAFTAAIEIDLNRAEAYLKSAEAYLELGGKDMAIAILEKGYANTQDSTIKMQLDALNDPFIDESYIEYSSLDEGDQILIQGLVDSVISGDDEEVYNLLTGSYLQMVYEEKIPSSIRTVYNSYKLKLSQSEDYDTSANIGTIEIRPMEGRAFLYSGMMLGEQLIYTKITGNCSAWNWNGYFEKDSNYWTMDGEYTNMHMTGNCVNALLDGTISTSYANGEEVTQTQYSMGKELGREDIPENLVITINLSNSLEVYQEWLW